MKTGASVVALFDWCIFVKFQRASAKTTLIFGTKTYLSLFVFEARMRLSTIYTHIILPSDN